MSNGGNPIPLSSSVGGNIVSLDDSSVPGKVIHANPADSNANHILQSILVGNPNSSQVSLWVAHVGPGIPSITDRSQMIRIDVPPTAEGSDVRLFYTPFILAPGFAYHISCELQPNTVPPYLYGFATVYPAAGTGFGGYGGLGASTQQSLGTVSAGTWVTVPFQYGTVDIPVNVTQDAANNRIALLSPGVWAITSYVTLGFKKVGNTDRTIFMRFWNETKGVEVSDAPFPLYVEQGTNGGSWAVPAVPADVAADVVGDYLRVELGGAANDFETVNLDKAGLNVFRIG